MNGHRQLTLMAPPAMTYQRTHRGEEKSISHPYADPGPVMGLVSEEELGAGTLRFAFNGGSLANFSIRSLFIALALISVKPGLWSPTILEEKDERSRVACWA